MNILYLNGSPRKNASGTKRIADAFVEGMLAAAPSCRVDEVILYDKTIAACQGCFGCWHVTPGICLIRDDMDELLPLFRRADTIVWAMPLYYFGMPSGTKAFLDRLMPNNSPLFEDDNGSVRHPQLHDAAAQRHVLISTCGFQVTERNFEALAKQFELLCGDRLSKILCPIGGAFSAEHPGREARKRLSEARDAGAAYALSGTISADVEQALSAPVFDPDRYMAVVNRMAAIAESPAPRQERKEPSARANAVLDSFVKRYRGNPDADSILAVEIAFCDEQSAATIRCNAETCSVGTATDESIQARMEADVTVWERIVSEEVSITDELLEGTLMIWGDFDTVLRFDEVFDGIIV